MANTNFASMTNEQYTVWSRKFWLEVRNRTFLNTFTGSGPDSMIQRINELSDTKDGARAVITLLHDSTGDGVVGDNQLLGNETALTSSEEVIRIDQWRDAHRNSGRMNAQKAIVNFRDAAKRVLSYTGARVLDELQFLTLSGVSYAFRTNGAARVGSQLPLLEFATDVSAPTSARYYRWNGTTKALVAPDTTAMTATDTPSWAMLVDCKAKLVNSYIPVIRSENGIEMYNVFMTPSGIASLKKDPDFLDAMKLAQDRGESNPIFKGTKHGGKKGIYIDGLNILEYRNVFNTSGLASGSKWGSGGLFEGQRVLFCGAQALAMADIDTDVPEWIEEYQDYKNIYGISVAKRFGLLKPKFFSNYANSIQDFAVMCVDTTTIAA